MSSDVMNASRQGTETMLYLTNLQIESGRDADLCVNELNADYDDDDRLKR